MHRSAEPGPRASLTPISTADTWWSAAVFYQIYIRSFSDSDGDGVGDLAGIRERLDYLSLLGVDALWITPFYPSPMADHGYDISNPRDVEPRFGTLDGFDELVQDVHAHGMRIIVDLVPNHTSDHHPWFVAALAAPPGSPERDRYVFRDGKGPDGAQEPNNWQSMFFGPAWTRAADGQWYLHLFAPQQPDLDWENPEVHADLERTMRFWLDRGADGFRIDVANGMVKAHGLPDMADPFAAERLRGDPSDPRVDNDGVHDVHRMVRRVLDSYPERMAVGEVWLYDDERLARYVRPDELHLVFNFRLEEARWEAGEITAAIANSLAAMGRVGAVPTWVLSNHDVPRHVTRYGGGEIGQRRARAAALLQLALPGAAFLYNGDELGLPWVDLPDEALQDPIWERSGHRDRGRDGTRIPMPWSGDKPPYGFTTAASSWLPMPDGWAGLTAEAELEQPDSMLSLYRTALQLRRAHPSPTAELEWLGAPPDSLAFRRSGGLVCAVNCGTSPVDVPPGQFLLSSDPLEGDQLPPDTAVWLLG